MVRREFEGGERWQGGRTEGWLRLYWEGGEVGEMSVLVAERKMEMGCSCRAEQGLLVVVA